MLWATVIVHVAPVPQPAPFQPTKCELVAWSGVAVSVTHAPAGYSVLHAAEQLMPAGVLVTVPYPSPVTDTLTVYRGSKSAVTAAGAVMEQAPFPEQPPLQPAKYELPRGSAVSVTRFPMANVAEQEVVQLMPAGALDTAPYPDPATFTTTVPLTRLNVATTALFPFMTTVHGPVPKHAPDHPSNSHPGASDAVSVTVYPLTTKSAQLAPQWIAPGKLDTVPPPSVVALRVYNCTGGAWGGVVVKGGSALDIWTCDSPTR
jgi:hypothetical protein